MIAVVPGSFDPITRGHLDVITRARHLFGEVIVAVGDNTTKNYLFTQPERVDLATRAVADIDGVRVLPLAGLLVDFVVEHGGEAIVKGLRFSSDFDYELQMAHLNSHMRPQVETVFLPAGRQFGTISSSLLRTIAHNGGDIAEFVTPDVLDAVTARLARGKDQ